MDPSSWRLSLAAAGDSGLDNLLTNANFPGVAILATSGVLGMIFVIRQMVKFQREFTDFYVAENKKLRVEVSEKEDEIEQLRKELEATRQELIDHKRESMYKLAECEIKLASQEDHIQRLHTIVERRKLEREEGT